MKTRVILLLFLLLATLMPIFAQEKCYNKSRAEMHREFRDFKIKYIAQEIDLPADKFKEFSELYGQMEEEKHKVFSSTRRLEKVLRITLTLRKRTMPGSMTRWYLQKLKMRKSQSVMKRSLQNF